MMRINNTYHKSPKHMVKKILNSIILLLCAMLKLQERNPQKPGIAHTISVRSDHESFSILLDSYLPKGQGRVLTITDQKQVILVDVKFFIVSSFVRDSLCCSKKLFI